MQKRNIVFNILSYILLTAAALIFVAPIAIVLMNSFKSKFYISGEPFKLPDGETFEGFLNYTEGVAKTGFFKAFGWSTYFRVVFPILKPTAITVAILNAMWVWNDYLLPYLVIGSEYKTVPIAIQYLKGGYGSVDMGAMMAMLVLAIVPIVIFYLFSQKYIIKGVVAGAVKG